MQAEMNEILSRLQNIFDYAISIYKIFNISFHNKEIVKFLNLVLAFLRECRYNERNQCELRMQTEGWTIL